VTGAAPPVAIVTGGGSGMGAGTARRLSGDGLRVVVVDRDGPAADAVAAGLTGDGVAVTADVSLEADVDAYTAAAVKAFGSVDRVVLNAGIPGGPVPLADEDPATFDRIVAVNLRGVFLGLRAALRRMRDQGSGGAIVVTSSTSGLSGSDLGSYSAAKHGVVALTKTAAVEGAAYGVRVNAVAPGSIDTPMMRVIEAHLGGGEAARRALHGTTPLGRSLDRHGSVEEVAAVTAFLLSDEAGWVTGVTVPVDGGVLATDPFVLPALEPA